MNPKPLSSLNHLTVPVAMVLIPSAGVLCTATAEVCYEATTCGRSALLVSRVRPRTLTSRTLARIAGEVSRAFTTCLRERRLPHAARRQLAGKAGEQRAQRDDRAPGARDVALGLATGASVDDGVGGLLGRRDDPACRGLR